MNDKSVLRSIAFNLNAVIFFLLVAFLHEQCDDESVYRTCKSECDARLESGIDDAVIGVACLKGCYDMSYGN